MAKKRGGYGKKSISPKPVRVLQNPHHPQINKIDVWKPINQESWDPRLTNNDTPQPLYELLFSHTIFGSHKSPKFMKFTGF